MQDALRGTDIANLVSLAIQHVPDNYEVGLMIAGGAGAQDPCSNILSIQPPALKRAFEADIQSKLAYLNDFKPQGPGNIELAVLEAIKILGGRKNVQEIIVITSGVDERCGSLDGNLLKLAASQYNVQFTLKILSVGDENKNTKEKYIFADYYRTVELAEQIPESVSEIASIPIFSYYAPPTK